MSTSDADKPPISLPAPVIAAGEVPPSLAEESGSGEEEVVVALVSRRLQPGVLLHLTFLVIGVVVVTASLSLSIRDGEQVILPIVNAPLPGTCTFRSLTGFPCPGCGLTRSFICMAHGQVGEAWRYNPAGLFFFAVVAFQIPYRIYQIVRIRRGKGEHRFVRFDNWVLFALVIVLIIQWIYGMFVGPT